MILREFPAGPATVGLVRAYRFVRFEHSGNRDAPVKVCVPTTDHYLEFSLRAQDILEYPDGCRRQNEFGLFVGSDVTVRRIVPTNFLLLQVVLEPSALHRITLIPAHELRNEYIDAVSILGNEVRQINEQLQEANSYQRMTVIVDDYIAKLAQRVRTVRNFAEQLRILRDKPVISIDWLANQSSLSLRQFERHCRERTGMCPKSFARLARFERAYRIKFMDPRLDWLTIAINCGYFDYQHMARDFKNFTGQTPPEAIATQNTSPENLLGVPMEFDITWPKLLAN